MINPSAIKGAAVFLELARRFPDMEFAAVPTWATTAADRAALERLPNVRVLEPDENIDAIFARTSVLVVPSLWGEAFGMVVVEAMLRGIPVLASHVGGLPEAKLGIDYLLPVRPIARYEESRDDRLLPTPVIPAQDIEPWANALQALRTDRFRYRRLSAASRQAALDYVASLSIVPLERYLEALPLKGPSIEHPSRSPQWSDGVARSIENLSPEKRELLAALLEKRSGQDGK
jgi:glycosyltransferase involved in cell wall biosynthesis